MTHAEAVVWVEGRLAATLELKARLIGQNASEQALTATRLTIAERRAELEILTGAAPTPGGE